VIDKNLSNNKVCSSNLNNKSNISFKIEEKLSNNINELLIRINNKDIINKIETDKLNVKENNSKLLINNLEQQDIGYISKIQRMHNENMTYIEQHLLEKDCIKEELNVTKSENNEMNKKNVTLKGNTLTDSEESNTKLNELNIEYKKLE